MNITSANLWILPAALLVGGCAANTYLEAKANTAAGGQQSRDIQTARTSLESAQTQNVQLQDAKLQRERELDRQDKRIRALEDDLKKQDAALAGALKAKQVTQARYAEIKREMDSIRSEMQSVDMQNLGDKMSRTADPKADAAKEARLRDLERRKKELEGTLAALAKR
jgi:chromosome segregation ATPase